MTYEELRLRRQLPKLWSPDSSGKTDIQLRRMFLGISKETCEKLQNAVSNISRDLMTPHVDR